MARKFRVITNYWISYSDLIAGLLFVFLAIIIISNIQFKKERDEREKKIKEIAKIQNQIKNFLRIRKTIKDSLKNRIVEGVEIDSVTGDLVFKENILFDLGQHKLKRDGKRLLKKIMPIYFNTLFDSSITQNQIDRIMIIGHASMEKDIEGPYLRNLDLSQKRALSVSNFLIKNEKARFEKMKKYLVALGRSYSDATGRIEFSPPSLTIREQRNWVRSKRKLDRKVVIKYRLKYEEMLDNVSKEIKSILEQ